MNVQAAIEFLTSIVAKGKWEGRYLELSYRLPNKSNPKKPIWKDVAVLIEDGWEKHAERVVGLADKADIYFCPLPFTAPRRVKANTGRTQWLWADLDEIDASKVRPRPAVLWESSPKRYQCLWLLKHPVKPKEAEEFCRNLAYATGADKSGWDLTQVLRVPHTVNHKYPAKPVVKLLHSTEHTINPYKIGKAEQPKQDIIIHDEVETAVEFLLHHGLPIKLVNELFFTEPVEGQRSDVLWRLQNELAESGMSPDDIERMVHLSPWNKYRGRRDEHKRLQAEARKVTKIDRAGAFKIASYSDVLSIEQSEQPWAVRHAWLQKSYGILAGEPKCYKSLIALELAMSIASGTPFMSRYEVYDRGPVLMVQNEDAPWIVRDRLAVLARWKGLIGSIESTGTKYTFTYPQHLPMYFVQQQGFLLDWSRHKKNLEAMVRDIKPKMIILDPLYLMVSHDINSAKELQPTLHWLLEFQASNNSSLLLIHHHRKGEASRSGQRMLGSVVLHGWTETAWYVSRCKADNTVEIEREFRASPANKKWYAQVNMEPGNPVFRFVKQEFANKETKHGTK